MHRLTGLSLLRFLFGILASFLLPGTAQAQITNVTNNTSTPIHGAGHDYVKMLSETVNPSNGSVSLRIQVPTPGGRGLSYPFAFAYDSNDRHVSSDGLGYLGWRQNEAFLSQGGWSYNVPLVSNIEVTYPSSVPPDDCTFWKDYIFQDGSGSRHALRLSAVLFISSFGCQTAVPQTPTQALNAGDDYYRASVGSLGSPIKVADADGTVYQAPNQDHLLADGAGSSLVTSIEDRNGNKITVTDLSLYPTNGAVGSFTVNDTLGRTLLSSSGFGTTGNTVNVAGLTTPYSLTWGTTAFNFTVGTTTVWTSDTNCRNSIPAASGTQPVVTGVTLPNNTSYQFTYSSIYGLLTKISYPTGGYVSYTWGLSSRSDSALFEDAVGGQNTCLVRHDTPAVTHRYVSYDGVNIALQQDFSYSTTWNPGDQTWNSKTTTVVTTDFVTGASYSTVYTYSGFLTPTQPNDWAQFGAQVPLEQTVVYKDSAGATLRTVSKTWIDQYELASEQAALENGLTSKVTYTYGLGAQVTEKAEYDFGSGAPGSLVRRTTTSYQSFAATPIYPATATIFDRPSLATVYDGAGAVKAQTQYVYDGTALTATSGVTGHDYTNYGSGYLNRGNATQVKRWLNTTSTWLTTNNAYNDLGNLLSTTDPGSHTTTFDYTDNWYGAGCVGSNTQAYVTQATNHLGQRAQTMYFPCTGLAQKTRDENDILAGLWGRTFSYDQMNRLLSVVQSDGGESDYSYNDTAPVSMTSTTRITSSLNLGSYAVGDGLGRVQQTQLTSDPEGTVKVDTTYDALSRTATASNPYRSTGEATYGSTSYTYDALGRVTKVIPPDGSSSANNVTSSYSGNCTTVTDQAAKKRKSCADGLGRLTQVFEPDSGGSFLYETDYQYDTLDNLTRVDQKGNDGNSANWRTRTFTYDSLSRLLTASNPESGAINYTYDSDSNLLTKVAPLPNQTGSSTVTTTYSYDALHRLTGKTYSNGDPAVSYFYDQTSYNGLTITNGKGRRTGMSDASGATAWSYDSEGRPLKEQRTISGVTKAFQYSYNLDGSMASLTWSNNRTLDLTYNAAARLTAATETYQGVTNNYATAATYAPQGALASVTYGKVTGGFAGIFSVLAYNKRLQPTDIMATTGALDLSCTSVTGKVLHLNYNFALATADNGNVQTINNCRNTARTQSFTYDELNRVKTAEVPTAWGLSFGYDVWANLLSQTVTKGSAPMLSVAANTKNQIVGFAYDAAGNLTNDGTHTYTYDAENRITTTAGATYTYDGDGRRVKKSSGTLYYYIPGSGEVLQESDLAGNTRYRYVFFNGKRIVRRNSSTGEILYYFSDHLGSSNVVTNATGTTIKEESDYYPFGGERVITDTVSDQTYKFTGKERDPESGLDYFGARYYASGLGRFTSRDPVTMTRRRLSDPQQLNLYAYVRNNPLVHVDPTGMVLDPSELSEADKKKYEEAKQRAYQTDKNGKFANPQLHALFEILDRDKRVFHLAGGKDLGTGIAAKFEITKRTADGKDFTEARVSLNFNLVKGGGDKGNAREFGVDFDKFSGLTKDSSRFAELTGHEFTHGFDSIKDPAGAVAMQDLIDQQGGGRTPLAPDEQQKLDNALSRSENSAYSEEKKVNEELRNSEKLPK